MDNGKSNETLRPASGENWNFATPTRDLGNIGKKAIFSPETNAETPTAEAVEIVTLSERPATADTDGSLSLINPNDFHPDNHNHFKISPEAVRAAEDIRRIDSPARLDDAYWAANEIYRGKDAQFSDYDSYIKNGGKKAA